MPRTNKITCNHDKTRSVFSELQPTQLFRLSGDPSIIMKVESSNSLGVQYNAVHLINGMLGYFEPTDNVFPLTRGQSITIEVL